MNAMLYVRGRSLDYDQFHMGAAHYEQHGAVEHNAPACTIAPVLVSPRSRGEVRLRSADPRDEPRILTNALTEPENVASMIAGLRLALRIAASPPLGEKIVRELTVGAAVRSDRRLDAVGVRISDASRHGSSQAASDGVSEESGSRRRSRRRPRLSGSKSSASSRPMSSPRGSHVVPTSPSLS